MMRISIFLFLVVNVVGASPSHRRLSSEEPKQLSQLRGASPDTTTTTSSSLSSPYETLDAEALTGYVSNHPYYRNLVNFDENLPFDQSSQVPYFWHIHKAGGSTMKHILTCLDMTQTRRSSSEDCNDKDENLHVCPQAWGQTVNADASSPDGIERIERLGLVEQGIPNLVIDTSRFYEALKVLNPQHQGRLFVVFRNPIERAISKYYYNQVATWERNYKPEIANMTMIGYAKSMHCIDNWVTRRLVHKMNPQEKVTEGDLRLAKEILRQKAFILLTDSLSQSVYRLSQYFGWPIDGPKRGCIDRFAKYEPVNQNPHPVPAKDSPEWSAIRETVVLDMELYRYAMELYHEVQSGFLHSKFGPLALPAAVDLVAAPKAEKIDEIVANQNTEQNNQAMPVDTGNGSDNDKNIETLNSSFTATQAENIDQVAKTILNSNKVMPSQVDSGKVSETQQNVEALASFNSPQAENIDQNIVQAMPSGANAGNAPETQQSVEITNNAQNEQSTTAGTSVSVPDQDPDCPVPDTLNIPVTHPVWSASYPGSGAKLTWKLIRAITGIFTGDDHDHNGRVGLGVVSAIKTHYPSNTPQAVIDKLGSETLNRITRTILLTRNPLNALPSYCNFVYERQNKLRNHSTRAPLDYWITWRNENFEKELKLWVDHQRYWLDKGNSDSLYHLTFEHLVDPNQGPDSLKGMGEFLSHDEEIPTVPSDRMDCIWEMFVDKSTVPGEKERRRSLRHGGADHYTYTEAQLDQIIMALQQLENDYMANYPDFAKVMGEYSRIIQESRVQMQEM